MPTPAPALADPLLPPADVAAWVGATEKTLSMWRYRKTGPRYIRAGGFVRYRTSDVQAWLEAQTSDPAA